MVSFRGCGGAGIRARGRFAPPAGSKSMRQVVIVLGGCLGPARLGEFGDEAVGRRRTFDRRPAVVTELDPALVKAVKHPNPRQRILRALRTEHLLPALAR